MAEEKKVVYVVEVKTEDNQLQGLGKTANTTSKNLDKTTKAADKTSKSTTSLSKGASQAKDGFGKFGGMLKGIPQMMLGAAKATWQFTVALLANPVAAIAAAIVGLIALVGLALSKFQPFVDFISDKFAFLQGGLDGFIQGLKSMGDVLKAVFSGDLKGAVGILNDAGSAMIETAKATEVLNKALRDYEIQQKLNDATSAEVLANMKKLEGVYKDQNQSIETRKKAFEEYYAMKKAQAEDDYNAQKKVSNAEINLMNKKYGVDIKNATDANTLYKAGKILKEEYLHLLDVIIKTTELEGKVADESAKKARESNRLRNRSLTETLKVLKASVAYYEATAAARFDGSVKLTQKLVDEQLSSLNKLAKIKKNAAKKELDATLLNFGNNAALVKEARLKYATAILKADKDLNDKRNKVTDNFTKQQIQEIEELNALYIETNKTILEDAIITTDAELKQRVASHQKVLDITKDTLNKKALAEKWSDAKLKLELLKADAKFNKKKEELEANLQKNKTEANKTELDDKKKKLEALADIQTNYNNSLVKTDEAQLKLHKELLDTERDLKIKQLDELELTDEEYKKQSLLITETYNNKKSDADTKYFEEKEKKEADSTQKTIDAAANTFAGLQGLMSQAIELNTIARDIELDGIKSRYEQMASVAEDSFKREEAALQAKLKAGTINQATFDKKMLLLRSNYDKKNSEATQARASEESAAKKKAFEDNKKYQIASALMNGAQALIGTWAGYAELGIPGAILAGIQSALIIALTSAQVSQISSQTFASGGKILGDTHAQASGGTMISQNVMAEGGEFVVNRAATAQYEPILDNINSKGNPNGDVSDVGELIDYNKLASLINNKKVYVVSSDITDQQEEDAKIVQLASN